MTAVSYFIWIYFILNCILTFCSLSIREVRDLLNTEPVWNVIVFTTVMISCGSILFTIFIVKKLKTNNH